MQEVNLIFTVIIKPSGNWGSFEMVE